MAYRFSVLPCTVMMSVPLGLLAAAPAICAQSDSGVFELHANKAVTARDIGLPVYPGAKAYKDPDKDSVDMGFTFGETHFRLLAVEYLSDAPPQSILDFYRKPLSHYGEVLECDHGKPVGPLTKTRSGLTCGDGTDSSTKINGVSSDGHDLRAGTPERMHLVGISDGKDGQTRFGLVYMELPKNTGKKN